MSKRLELAILAQALLDVLDGADSDEAFAYISKYPKLLSKLRRRLCKARPEVKARWSLLIESALGR